MNEELLEKAAYEGVTVDLLFEDKKPTFGDLFLICGFPHSYFPPSGDFAFDSLSRFGFEQVDDYFGIRSIEEEGDDVKVWLSPLVGEYTVYHHHGPFDGIRLSYSILRNPPKDSQFFLTVIAAFAEQLPVQVIYRLRERNLGNPSNLSILEEDISEVIEYWRGEGIEPGSDDALMVNF